MKKALVPLADGFEEMEAVIIIDVLRRAGVSVTTAGLKKGTVTGSHRIQMVPDRTLDEVKEEPFDLLVLPGGQPGSDHLRRDARVLDLLRRRHEQKAMIAAICAAPLALRDAGILTDCRLTSHPSVEKELPAEHYQVSRIVVDGHVITSRGPGTAMEFALKLAGLLVGEAKAEELRKAMIVREEACHESR